MSAKSSNKKIYQVAKEINISHETLIEYLGKRGHSVKSHMSVVTDEMMHDILAHFKKDREVAEKHQRKIQSIRESRKKAEQKTTVAEAEEPKEKPAKKPRKAAGEVVEESSPAPEAEVPQLAAEVAAPGPVVASDVETAGPESGAGAPGIPKEEIVQAAAETPAPKKPEMFRARRLPKMGLKVMGQIDLDDVRKREAAVEGGRKAVRSKTSGDDGADRELKRRKKKKRIRTEATVTPSDDTEEILRRGKKRKKTRLQEVDKEEVKGAIKRTLAEMDETGAATSRTTFKKKRKEKRHAQELADQEAREKEQSILKVTEFVSVQELSRLMGITAAEVIKKCIDLGLMVSINQRLEKDTITLVASEYGFEVQFY